MATVPVVYSGRPIDSSIGTTINIDFSSDLTLDHESEVPLLTLLSKLRDEKALTYQFKFAIGRFAPRTGTILTTTTVGTAGSTVSVVLTNATQGGYFTDYDLIEFEVPGATEGDGTNTYVGYIIPSGVSSATLSVKPFDPALLLPVMPAGTVVRIIGSTMPENASGRPSRQTVPTVYTQYIQTFEDYYQVSRVQATNRQYTDPERSRLREEARKKHALDQEYAFFFARKVADTTTNSLLPRYMMDGFFAQVSTNKINYGLTLTQPKLNNFMTAVHNPSYSGGNKRMVLASGDLLGQVNDLATAALRISTKDTTWGPSITEIQYAGKVWQWIEAPVLSDARPGWGAVIHPMFIKKRTLIPTMFEMNVQNPIDKFYKDGFYTGTALELRLEEVAGIIAP